MDLVCVSRLSTAVPLKRPSRLVSGWSAIGLGLRACVMTSRDVVCTIRLRNKGGQSYTRCEVEKNAMCGEMVLTLTQLLVQASCTRQKSASLINPACR